MKTIIITGATGQIGQYLIKYLQDKYDKIQIIGTTRNLNPNRVQKIYNTERGVIWEKLELGDIDRLKDIVLYYRPDYFVNCAGFTNPRKSWNDPVKCFLENTIYVIHQLEIIRKFTQECRYLNLGSVEELKRYDLDGNLWPENLYGSSKRAIRDIVSLYREKYNLFATQVHLNHCESILRSPDHIVRKISKATADIKRCIKKNILPTPLAIGNLEEKISLNHCYDIVDGLWKILNQDKFIKDYVLESDKLFKIRDIVEIAFKKLNIPIEKIENNAEPVADLRGHQIQYTLKGGLPIVVTDLNFYEKIDPSTIYFDFSQDARKDLKWKPKISFEQLVEEMVRNDYNLIK